MDNVPPSPPPQPPYGQPPFTPPAGQPPYVPPGQPPYAPPGQYPGYPGQPPKSHTGRNCLFGCLALLLLGALAVGGVMYFAYNKIKSNEVYKTAVERAKSNQQVIDALGSPISESFPTETSYNFINDSADAAMHIPISGPKGKGTIEVAATKSGGAWHYPKLLVHLDGGGQDILLNDSTQ